MRLRQTCQSKKGLCARGLIILLTAQASVLRNNATAFHFNNSHRQFTYSAEDLYLMIWNFPLNCRRVTFICGEAGVCALGAVVAHHSSDEKLCQHYITQFKEVVNQFKILNTCLLANISSVTDIIFFTYLVKIRLS